MEILLLRIVKTLHRLKKREHRSSPGVNVLEIWCQSNANPVPLCSQIGLMSIQDQLTADLAPLERQSFANLLN